MSDTKMLYLVRHAKSDWHNNLSDFDRPLNKRGMRDAPEMGRRLKARGIIPKTLICSPATRAMQTMELLTPEIGYPAGSVTFNENIYEASLSTLLDIVYQLDNRFSSAMIIGHNPAMSLLMSRLCAISPTNLPTCSIATIALSASQWKGAAEVVCSLVDLDYPKKSS